MVTCPNCRTRLSVKNEPGVQEKILGCPICKYKAKVSKAVHIYDTYTITHLPTEGGEGDETE